MIKVGDILLWGNNRHRYIVLSVSNDYVKVEHIPTEEIYFEDLSNIRRNVNRGVIIIEESESIIPRKYIMKHTI